MASGVAFLSLLVPITAFRPPSGDGIYSSALTATAAEPRASSRTLESMKAMGVAPQGHLLGHANRSHGHINKAAAASVEKEESGQKIEVQASTLFQKKSSARAAKAGKDEEDIKAFLYAFRVSSIIAMGGAAGYYFYTEERKKKKNSKEFVADNRKPVLVSDVLDALPLGRFHALHLARQVTAWAVFSMSQEITPYLFPGLRQDFGVDDAELAHVASVFPLGCMIGAVVASFLVDGVGRRATMVAAAPISSILNLGMAGATSFTMVLILRTVQSVMWALTMTSIATWYAEFLPTTGRGPLMAAVAVGWPLGRGMVILTASSSGDDWRALFVLGAVGFAALALLVLLAPESPRFLVVQGDVASAQHVLKQIHAMNGSDQVWDHDTPLRIAHDGDAHSWKATSERLCLLCHSSCRLLSFSITLFGMLSITTVLIDTWGPRMFQQLVSPGAKELPHSVLLLFNFGDLFGVVLSIFVADRLGRRGSFMIGFFVQSALFLVMAMTALTLGGSNRAPLVVVLGTVASACRCFAWEAAHFWTLEAFGTALRGMAFGIATAAMRLFSVLSLEVSGWYIGGVSPGLALSIFSLLLGVGGIVACSLLPMETAGAPMSEG